jgi:protoporphyrin/coproporphyrin ferrochelatase
MRFLPEPPHQHGRAAKVGVLLVNLGTPTAPTAAAVRPYLAEFLADPRVVEIPRLVWWLILNGAILPFRPKKSAAKYASIWTPDGSPLAVWTRKQTTLLQGFLGEAGVSVVVRHAMRYGEPAVATELNVLKAKGCDRILVLPLYPQYSATTTASVFDAVYAWAGRTRTIPELRFVNRYHDDPGYIDALARRVRAHWDREGRGEHLLMSFHGVPQRTLTLGDPYHCECHKTARLLGERLGLAAAQYSVSFQSRLGRAKWLEPYTEPTLIALAKKGVSHVQVVCPGFTSDCLETLEEIAMEGREAYLHAGGKTFDYIACLNDDPAWIRALTGIVREHTQGWPVLPALSPEALADRQAASQASAARARALGAQN